MDHITYRPATPDDVSLCIQIRGLTRENAFSEETLRALGITVESWSADIVAGSSIGVVACVNGRTVGYCFGERSTGEVTVLALLGEYEGQGIGKSLLGQVTDELHHAGFERLFLACASDPNVRSYGFYRHLGWTWTGECDEEGDHILEFAIAEGGLK
ncbi:GNAT family N-acetyltransferase [Pseudomonas palleroniana]|uniref:GNAT family N-acetyltransferase n=1 Tax=Pseudomonas palleroniana TaxID=191390 RepID=UPI0018E6A1A2|nr:GNAT family N-acetyltransferase [Pseudomonas palleroniana]MBI6908132.1 GNAT family N-acetyltransferase [Pseudomonas palleroniana]